MVQLPHQSPQKSLQNPKSKIVMADAETYLQRTSLFDYALSVRF
jgi:hypothetical protein